MSVGTRLKRLRTQVDWLDENGELRLLEMEWKLLQMKEQISARDPALARRLGFLPPVAPAPRPVSAAPPPVRVGPPPAPPAPAQPHPEERPARPRLEGSEPAPRPLPILLGVSSASARKRLDAPLRGAPQDEVVRVESFVDGVARLELPPAPAQPHPEERPARPRLEGSEPARPLVQPFTYDPPPEMQIRPVAWRRRGPQDYEDDDEDMYGKCIVDYDPLGYLDADDD